MVRGPNPRMTASERKLLEYIQDYIKTHGYPPSTREMVENTEATSTSTVSYRLDRLEMFGKLTRSRHVARSVVLQ